MCTPLENALARAEKAPPLTDEQVEAWCETLDALAQEAVNDGAALVAATFMSLGAALVGRVEVDFARQSIRLLTGLPEDKVDYTSEAQRAEKRAWSRWQTKLRDVYNSKTAQGAPQVAACFLVMEQAIIRGVVVAYTEACIPLVVRLVMETDSELAMAGLSALAQRSATVQHISIPAGVSLVTFENDGQIAMPQAIGEQCFRLAQEAAKQGVRGLVLVHETDDAVGVRFLDEQALDDSTMPAFLRTPKLRQRVADFDPAVSYILALYQQRSHLVRNHGAAAEVPLAQKVRTEKRSLRPNYFN